jgi:ATP-binding cassette subfamily B protein
MKTPKLVKRFIPYYRPYRRILTFDLICAVLTTLCEIVLPLIVRAVTDRAIGSLSALTASYVMKLGGLYIALRLVDAFANYYMSSIGHAMGTHIETDMRNDLFAHLQQLSFSFYTQTKVGQIMARITSDLFEVTEFAHHCPEEFLIALFKIAAAFTILCGTNVFLTLLVFAMLPLMYLFTRFFGRRMREAFKEQRHQVGEINAQVEDSLLGIRVVKSFSNEPIEEEKFRAGNHIFLKIKIKAYQAMAGFHTTTRVFDGLMYILVVIVGALFIIAGSITPADYVAYLLYVSMLLTSVRRIVEFQEQFQRGMTGIERFLELMDTPAEICDLPDARPLMDVKGDIAFKDVSFHYSQDDKEVLAHLDLTCRAGDAIALVGPSGGGKTTLCNLIPRFYELTGGAILIDGQDIKHLTLKSLRENIGMVQQDVYLFTGTVYDNIAYGHPGADREAVTAAAEKAGAHAFIMQLPEGYDTYVGERGVRLSGGQKQRIAIARVFLKNPPILILDEATSALDNDSERLVQASLEELAKGRTTFTIAHRLTTIKNADYIWVLTDQGVEERGSHHELMARKGIYYHLYSMYTEA